jgi:hypothetical protein
LQEVEVARPLTHDLLKNIFTALNAHIVRVEVSDLHDDTFFGSIVAEANGQTVTIDARPSDALNLAVRAHVPILVARSVMDSAGVIPEKDLQSETIEKPADETKPDVEVSADRLSVFEDFLEKLDIDPPNDEDQEEDDKKE